MRFATPPKFGATCEVVGCVWTALRIAVLVPPSMDPALSIRFGLPGSTPSRMAPTFARRERSDRSANGGCRPRGRQPCLPPPREAALRGRPSRQRQVRAPMVVLVQPRADFAARIVATDQLLQVHRLVLQRPPQPLDEPVVGPAASAVHADKNARTLQDPEPGFARELAALVRVRDQRRFVALQRPR